MPQVAKNLSIQWKMEIFVNKVIMKTKKDKNKWNLIVKNIAL